MADQHAQNPKLTKQETADVLAFFEALTDEEFVSNPALSDPFTTK